MAVPHRRNSNFAWWAGLAYLLLLVVGIPWYWPADDRTIWVGMPAWVVVAVVVSFITSVFTAFLWLRCVDEDCSGDSGESIER